MLTSLSHFTIALTFASSILGAAIPTVTPTDITESHHDRGHAGTLWDNIYASAPGATPMAQVKLSASRRSGELWAGVEHEEIVPASSAPSRRSGELWKGFNHEEITSGSSAPSRLSSELWGRIEHEEIVPTSSTLSRRSGEIWAGIEHEEVSPTADV